MPSVLYALQINDGPGAAECGRQLRHHPTLAPDLDQGARLGDEAHFRSDGDPCSTKGYLWPIRGTVSMGMTCLPKVACH